MAASSFVGVFLVGLLISLCQESLAVRCYDCQGTSVADPSNCMEVNNETETQVKENCTGCSVAVAKTTIVKEITTVVRKCVPLNTPLPETCQDGDVLENAGTICYCKTDLCNDDIHDVSASTRVQAVPLYLALLVTMVAMITA